MAFFWVKKQSIYNEFFVSLVFGSCMEAAVKITFVTRTEYYEVYNNIEFNHRANSSLFHWSFQLVRLSTSS